MTVHLKDGFEDGTANAFSSIGSYITVGQRHPHTGFYGAYTLSGTNSGNVATDVIDGEASGFTRVYFKIIEDNMSDTQEDYILEIEETAATKPYLIHISILKSGSNLNVKIYHWHTTVDRREYVYTDVNLEVGQWYLLEVLCGTGVGASNNVWLDKSLIYSQAAYYYAGYFIGDIRYYSTYIGRLYKSIDDILVSDTRAESLPYPYYGGPFVSVGTITASTVCLKPSNFPYQRLSEALEQIREMVYETDYALWEWWIDDDDGEIHFGPRKGNDLSDLVKFRATFNLGSSSRSKDTTKSAQRVKITGGKSTTKGQDEVTSNWQADNDSIDELDGFYEEIADDKMAATRETANEFAKIQLAQLKDAVEEIEASVESESSLVDWDVGDDVTIEDSKSNIDAAAYRVKSVHYHINNDSGETFDVTVTNAWKDITDRIADIYKNLKQMQQSNVGLEDWTAGGTGQNDVTQDKLEDQWEIKKRYDSGNEMQEVDDISTADSYDTFGVSNGAAILMMKDSCVINGRTSDGAAQSTSVYSTTRTVAWNRNPRFMVDFVVDTWGGATGEYIQLFMDNSSGGGGSTDRFGFYFEKTAAGYDVECVVRFGNSEVSRNIGNLDITTVHTYEAKVNWKDKLIFFYIDEVPKAAISCRELDFPVASIDPTVAMDVMYINLRASRSGTTTEITCHYWKTQALKPQAAIED